MAIAPGERHELYAAMVADWLRYRLKIDLTDKEQDALAVLIGGIRRRLL